MQKLLFDSTVEKYNIGSLMKNRGTVVVGYSGGADSSCLLRLMNDYCTKNGIVLCAAHMNHMIRGDDAVRDEEFCRKTCEALGIRFFSKRVDVPALAESLGRGLEETARDVRYTFFDEVSNSVTKDVRGALIATAHNASDNLETVVLNILRGAGTHGLCGIDPVRGGRVIRPLICDSGESIRAWCRENSVEYVTDATNADTDYTRNHIRHNIIPQMRKICGNPETAVSRLTASVREDDVFLTSAANSYIKPGDTSVSRETLLSLAKPLSSRILRALYNNAKTGDSTIEEVHISDILRLIRQKTGYFALSLPGKMKLTADVQYLSFVPNDPEEDKRDEFYGDVFAYPDDGDFYENEHFIISFSVSEQKNSICCDNIEGNIYKLSTHGALCLDKIKGTLKIRYRRAGDVYVYCGMTRKVKKLFSDKKLRQDERRSLPVLYDEDGIVWIPGFPPRDGTRYRGDGEALYVTYTKK